MLQYWLTVLLKGIKDSFDYIRQDVHGIFFAILVLLIILLFSRLHGGWRDAFNHVWRTAGETIVAGVLAWWLVFCVHLIWEPYHLQNDLLANRSQLQGLFDSEVNESRACNAGLSTERARTQLLADRVASQQNLIDSQQGRFSEQQETINSQQATVNTCVVTLAKANAVEPVKITAMMSQDDASPEAKHTELVVVLTNKPITTLRMLEVCEKEIKSVTFDLANGSGYGGGVEPLGNGHGAILNLTFPVWTPDNPLLIRIHYNGDDIGRCGTKLM